GPSIPGDRRLPRPDRVAPRSAAGLRRLAGRLGHPGLLPHLLGYESLVPMVSDLALGRPPDPLGSDPEDGLGRMPGPSNGNHAPIFGLVVEIVVRGGCRLVVILPSYLAA